MSDDQIRKHDAQTQDDSPVRGRPVLSQDAKLKRQKSITDVALRLFQEEGYASVSMRRLGKELKLSPMALYRYFPSKLDILAHLWAHILTQAFEDVAKSMKGQDTDQQALNKAACAYVQYWLDNKDHYHLVFMTSGVSGDDVQSFVSDPETIAHYNIFFERVAGSLGLDKEDPSVKVATDGLICTLHGIMHSLITMRGYAWTKFDHLIGDAVSRVCHDTGSTCSKKPKT